MKKLAVWMASLALVALFIGGISVALATGETTGTNVACATATAPGTTAPAVTLLGTTVAGASLTGTTTPSHVIGDNGNSLETIPGVTIADQSVPGYTVSDKVAPAVTVADSTASQCNTVTYTIPTVTQTITNSTTAPPPTTTAPAQGAPVGNLFVSLTGSDASCTRSATPPATYPTGTATCATLRGACTKASAGDVIEIAGGNYTSQGDIRLDATGPNSCTAGTATNRIIFQPESGATVTFGRFQLGDSPNGVVGASNITVRNISGTFDGTLNVGRVTEMGSSNVTFQGINGRNGGLFGTTNAKLMNSDVGNCIAPDYDTSCNWKIDLADLPPYPKVGSGNSFTGNTFHDVYSRDLNLYHLECIINFFEAGTTISGNKFHDCSIYDIFVQGAGVSGMTIQNNWFGKPVGGNYPAVSYSRSSCIAFSDNTYNWPNTLIRMNSFATGCGGSWNDNGNTNAYSNFRVYGNILGDNYCGQNGIDFRYNVFPSASCSGTGNTNRAGAAPNYVNGSNDATQNYHLAGVLSFADNLVPTSLANGCPPNDIDGNPRPAGTNCDAGSHER